MKTRIILLLLMLFFCRLLYVAGGESAATDLSAGKAGRIEVADASAVGARLLRGVGVFGARVAAPGVLGMVDGHARDLEELAPVLRRSPQSRRERVEKSIRRVEQLDSMALAELGSGHPVGAFKHSLQAGGLVDAIRNDVLEDAVR